MTNKDTSAIATATTIACGTAYIAILSYRAWLKPPKCPNIQPTNDDYDDPSKLVKHGFSMKAVPQHLDCIIIGSGMGGLTTAALLAKEGMRVLVLEQHDIAGGNTHTFSENGYEFDTGLHYVGGRIGDKEKPSNIRKLLNYVTDEQVEWAPLDNNYDIAISGNDRFNICSSWTQLKKNLKEAFPDDTHAIDEYFKVVKRTSDLFPLFNTLKHLPEPLFRFSMWLFQSKLGMFQKTTKEVMETITTNKKLMGVLTYHYGDYGEPPGRGAFLLNAVLTDHFRSGAYYPIEGPLKIAASFVRVIESWGGKVLVRAPVSSLLVDETNKVYGVEVKGKRILAKSVVSSVGAPATFSKLIPESHRHLVQDKIDIMKDPDIAPENTLMSMFVGINDPDGTLVLPKSNYWIHRTWDHDENATVFKNDSTKPSAFFISFSSAKDPSYATRHPGKHVALVIGPGSFTHVEKFQNERVKHRSKEYNDLKEQWTKIYMEALLEQFPQLKDKIDFVDFGTALTNDFYLGTHRGAVYGLSHTPKRFQQHWLRPQTPISGLYLTGQDVAACGITGALLGGYACAYTMSTRCMFRTMHLME